MNFLIKNAIIVCSSSDFHLQKKDILITDGFISKIENHIPAIAGIRSLSYPNLHVSIGWFDPTASFGEPGYEYRQTLSNGLHAASHGGFSEVGLAPTTTPTPHSDIEVAYLSEKAKDTIYPTHAHIIGAATRERKGETIAEIQAMRSQKTVAHSDYKRSIEDTTTLKLVMQYISTYDGLFIHYPLLNSFCNEGIIHEGQMSMELGIKAIPDIAEAMAVYRDVNIAQYTNCKLHILNVSSEKSLKIIRDVKQQTDVITSQVSINNLYFDDTALKTFDPNLKLQPPIRSGTDRVALIDALREGVIDMVTSDHTPLDIEEKRSSFGEALYGSIGLESAFGMLREATHEFIDVPSLIDILTIRPRKRFGIEVPILSPNSLANITLFDPNHQYICQQSDFVSTARNACAVGRNLRGKVYGVIAHHKAYLHQ